MFEDTTSTPISEETNATRIDYARTVLDKDYVQADDAVIGQALILKAQTALTANNVPFVEVAVDFIGPGSTVVILRIAVEDGLVSQLTLVDIILEDFQASDTIEINGTIYNVLETTIYPTLGDAENETNSIVITSTGSPEDTTSTATPEDTTSAANPEDTTSAAGPEDTTSTAEREDATTSAIPDDTTSTATPEDTTFAASPEDTTSTATPEDTTSAASPEDTTSTAELEDTTTSAIPEDTTSTATLEDTTSAAGPEDTTSTAEFEDATTSAIPQDTTSTATPEETTSATSPEETTFATSPEDTTSTASPEDTTFTATQEDTTSAAGPEDTTSTAELEDTTTSAIPEDTTSTATPEDTTSAASPEDTTSTTELEDSTTTAIREDTTSTAMFEDTTSTPISEETNATRIDYVRTVLDKDYVQADDAVIGQALIMKAQTALTASNVPFVEVAVDFIGPGSTVVILRIAVEDGQVSQLTLVDIVLEDFRTSDTIEINGTIYNVLETTIYPTLGDAQNETNSIDVDECTNSPCEQTCENTEGSYTCSCPAGYVINNQDPTQCDISVVLDVQVTMNYDATNIDLSDSSTSEYAKLQADVELALFQRLVRTIRGLVAVRVTNLTSGSLIVDFDLEVNTEVDPNYETEVVVALTDIVQGDQLTVAGQNVTSEIVSLGNQTLDSNATLCERYQQLFPCPDFKFCVEDDGIAVCRDKSPPANYSFVITLNVDLGSTYFDSSHANYNALKTTLETQLLQKMSVRLNNLTLTVKSLSAGSLIASVEAVFSTFSNPNPAGAFAAAVAALNDDTFNINGVGIPVTGITINNQEVSSSNPCVVLDQIETCDSDQECVLSDGLPECRDNGSDFNLILGLTIGMFLFFLCVFLVAYGAYLYVKRNRRTDLSQDSYQDVPRLSQLLAGNVAKRGSWSSRQGRQWNYDAFSYSDNSSTSGTNRPGTKGVWKGAASAEYEDFSKTPWDITPKAKKGEEQGNFSWDFINRILDPSTEEFKIKRPQVSPSRRMSQ